MDEGRQPGQFMPLFDCVPTCLPMCYEGLQHRCCVWFPVQTLQPTATLRCVTELLKRNVSYKLILGIITITELV